MTDYEEMANFTTLYMHMSISIMLNEDLVMCCTGSFTISVSDQNG